MHFSLYLLQYQKERLKGEVRKKKGPCQKRVWGNKDCGRNANTETRGVKAREESQQTEMGGQENRSGKRRDKDKQTSGGGQNTVLERMQSANQGCDLKWNS